MRYAFFVCLLVLVCGCVGSPKETPPRKTVTTTVLVEVTESTALSSTSSLSTSSLSIESTSTTIAALSMPKTESSRFGFMHPQEAYAEARDVGARWERPHEGPFVWGKIEEKKGVYDWSIPDDYVKKSQSNGFNVLATIWPFVDWDQESCHTVKECRGYGFDGKGELPILRCKPCDMGAYSDFVSALVERYDGDGVDDMPGLVYPIRYWEASNEPEMQEDELTFFKGSPIEYLAILKTTYAAVKSADPEAKVLNGGFAGMSEDTKKFWGPVLEKGGAYFDIASTHSIGGDDEHLYVDETKKFLAQYGLNKPIWVTEAQYNGRGGKETSEDFAKLIARSLAYAYGNGAEKVFYIGLTSPTPGNDNAALLDKSRRRTRVYLSYKTLAEKLDYFTQAERIREDQYKFVVGGKPVWVLWGRDPRPGEIRGEVKVTYVGGSSTLMDAGELVLSESPVFVEEV